MKNSKRKNFLLLGVDWVGDFIFRQFSFLRILKTFNIYFVKLFHTPIHDILGQYFINMKEIFMAKKGALTGLLLFGIFFGAGT